MIQIIAFSFNRAMQLDTLLTSLIEKWKSPEYKIDVIYNYSNESFGDGYKLLRKRFDENIVNLHRENNMKPDRWSLREILYPANLYRLIRNKKLRKPKTDFRSIAISIVEQTKAENVMFLTDDSMFVSDVEITHKELRWINEKPTARQFSLRLGKGVSSLPSRISVEKKYCNWNMYENTGNWGYPFSVDAHIYNKNFLLRLLKNNLFTNPSTLEGYLKGIVSKRRWLAEGRCFADIKMLTFPINIVQNAVDNLSQDVSVEMLNQRYLHGDTLRYVVEKEYNATKQYVREIEFTDKEGCKKIVPISDELIHPNANIFKDCKASGGR